MHSSLEKEDQLLRVAKSGRSPRIESGRAGVAHVVLSGQTLASPT